MSERYIITPYSESGNATMGYSYFSPCIREAFRALPLLVFTLLAMSISALAQNEESSLLWRITGKGMAHPSYLYGTFHLRTKTLFDFPDSLYKAIDNTDIFALELNLDSVSDNLSAYMTEHSDDEPVKEKRKKDKKLKELLTKEELKELKELIAENLGVDPDELTARQMYLMKDKLVKHESRPDDMPTFMDAYLYSIARDKGKMIGGLEQLSDQMKLLSNPALNDVNPRKVLELLRKGGSLEEQMIGLYREKNLRKFGELSGVFSTEAENALITSRNKVMLRSMDSIMQLHSLFAAVGTLHLPGSAGLITLLRGKGYTVEPVFCATSTNGADYHFKTSSHDWVTTVNEQAGYSVRMPGKPSDIDAFGGDVKMKSYLDLATSSYFLIGHIPKPEGAPASNEAVIKRMQKVMLKEAKDAEIKDMETNGMKGKEYFFADKDAVQYRLQLFGNAANVYLLMASYGKSGKSNVDSFFSSFRLVGEPPAPAASAGADTGSAAVVTVVKKPGVQWQNNWDVNFFIPQQAGFSSDSKYFAMGYSKGRVLVFDAATGDVFADYQLHERHVFCTAFQPGGNLLVSGDKEGFMVIYDYVAGKQINMFGAHDKAITAITFSRDGKLLITGSKDKAIKIWDPQTGKLLRTLSEVTGNIQSLRITSDNKTIIAGTAALSKGLRLYNADNGAEIKTFESSNLVSLDLSPDGKYIATANLEKSVLLFNYKKYAPPTHLKGHGRWLTGVVFSPSGKVLYSSSEDRTVIAWNMLQLTPIGIVLEADKKIASISCSPDGKFLAVMDESGKFSVIDISKMEDGLK